MVLGTLQVWKRSILASYLLDIDPSVIVDFKSVKDLIDELKVLPVQFVLFSFRCSDGAPILNFLKYFLLLWRENIISKESSKSISYDNGDGDGNGIIKW